MDYSVLIPIATAVLGAIIGWGLPALARKTKNKTDDKIAAVAEKYKPFIVKTVEGWLRDLAKEDTKAAEQAVKVEPPRETKRDHRK